MGELVLLRHGATEWSVAGRHTSYTDLPLTADGERQARALAGILGKRSFAAVLCSPRQRARRTAELAGLAVTASCDDLVEWNYGEYEGITTAAIRQRRPDWNLWTDGCPGGETPEQVGARVDRVLAAVEPLLNGGDVAVVAHGHTLRVLGARWIGLPTAGGALLRLDTATLSTLGHEHGRRAISVWNAPAA
jgi:probable phosphoglycerate mutase